MGFAARAVACGMVGGYQAQPRNPCRHLTARHKEIIAAVRATHEIEAGPHHRCEVAKDRKNAGRVQMRQELRAKRNQSRQRGWQADGG